MATTQPGIYDDVAVEVDAAQDIGSLRSSVYTYKEEIVRQYHAFKEGAYFMPNDDAEQERLSMQNRAMFLAAGGQLHYASLDTPQNILDLGTGMGIWAVNMADKYPEAHIISVDLSLIQPNWVPPNIKFEMDEVEENWTWPRDHFDMIYRQFMLSGNISKFRKYFQQAFEEDFPMAV